MEKIISLYQHLYAWVGTAIAFMLTFFGEGASFITAIFVCSIVDLVLAMVKSHVKGQGILSRKIGRFITKTLAYVGLLICFKFLDDTLKSEDLWFTRIYSAIIIFSEIWSCLANLTIIFPNVPIFKLLQNWLKSEVESKLNIEVEYGKEAEHNGKEDVEQA